MSCSTQIRERKADTTIVTEQGKDTVVTTVNKASGVNHVTSTYDNPDEDLAHHKASLRELSDSAAFTTIHNHIIATMDKKHQDYFGANPQYQILATAAGDLFQNGKVDHAFVVYDRQEVRVSFIVYDELNSRYPVLYRDIQVINGLAKSDCNYRTYGTLDYQVASELIYQRDYLIKDPLKQIENTTCKLTEIAQDEDFVLESGCMSSNLSIDQNMKLLCIPTSSVYNNWECLAYDKDSSQFVMVYGQAFAD